jgi:hypothetical protein
VNGLYPPQAYPYTLELWAAAGQCDLSKGSLAGSVSFTLWNNSAQVTYQTANGFTMEETHVYIGTQQIPTNKQGQATFGPGQYPYQHNLDAATSDVYTIPWNNMVAQYLIAHAVVCTLE